MTPSTLNRFTKMLILGAIVATAATQAAGAVSRPTIPSQPPDVRDAAEAVSSPMIVSRPPDVRDAAAQLTVPDAFERYAASHPYGKGVSSPQQADIPSYTPKMLAAHYNREDLLYQPRPPVSTISDTLAPNGFNWSDWAIGLGSGIGLILTLGAGLAMGRQWRHRAQTA